MCGRFININKINKLKKIFDIKQYNESLEDTLSYNIAPSNNVNIIINNTDLQIEKAEWGIKYKISYIKKKLVIQKHQKLNYLN